MVARSIGVRYAVKMMCSPSGRICGHQWPSSPLAVSGTVSSRSSPPLSLTIQSPVLYARV